MKTALALIALAVAGVANSPANGLSDAGGAPIAGMCNDLGECIPIVAALFLDMTMCLERQPGICAVWTKRSQERWRTTRAAMKALTSTGAEEAASQGRGAGRDVVGAEEATGER